MYIFYIGKYSKHIFGTVKPDVARNSTSLFITFHGYIYSTDIFKISMDSAIIAPIEKQ
jgi:hypothetical protein